jgi:hypothetical protein
MPPNNTPVPDKKKKGGGAGPLPVAGDVALQERRRNDGGNGGQMTWSPREKGLTFQHATRFFDPAGPWRSARGLERLYRSRHTVRRKSARMNDMMPMLFSGERYF